MAYISNPKDYSSSPNTLNDLSSYLVAYAGSVGSEPVWNNGSGLPIAYKKRQALAQALLAGNEQYITAFAVLLGNMAVEELNRYANNLGYANLYRWLEEGKVLDIEYAQGNYGSLNSVGRQSGVAIFDKLAGVTNLDMQ